MPAPPKSALSQLKVLDPRLVDQLRDRFLSEVGKNPEQYEPCDVDEIRKNQWQTQRFLLESKLNLEQAFTSMRDAMQWRHQQKINEISSKDFPREYYQCGYIVRHGRDLNGATVIYFRANIHRKTGWNECLKRFFVYQIELIDRHCDGKGVTLVMDCSQIGVSNVDVDLLKFIVQSFSRYYPKLFDAILINQLPFLLQYLFKLVQQWLPEDDRKFFHMTTKKTIENFIAPDQLPPFLGGPLIGWSPIPGISDFSKIPDAKQLAAVGGDSSSLKPDDLDYLKPYNIEV